MTASTITGTLGYTRHRIVCRLPHVSLHSTTPFHIARRSEMGWTDHGAVACCRFSVWPVGSRHRRTWTRCRPMAGWPSAHRPSVHADRCPGRIDPQHERHCRVEAGRRATVTIAAKTVAPDATYA